MKFSFKNTKSKKKDDVTDSNCQGKCIDQFELLKMSVNTLEYTLNTLVCQVNFLTKQITDLNEQFAQMTFSNESFKHQLHIEEALRNQEIDIRLLKSKIEKTIDMLEK